MGVLRTTRKGNVTTISFTGPFFEKDPEKTFNENLDVMLRAMADEGAQDVRAQIDSHEGGMPRWTGWSASRITARRNFPADKSRGYSLVWTSTTGLSGKPWLYRTLGSSKSRRLGVSAFKGNASARTLAAESTIEGRWHPFRITKNRLMASRAVNKAELTKGLE